MAASPNADHTASGTVRAETDVHELCGAGKRLGIIPHARQIGDGIRSLKCLGRLYVQGNSARDLTG